jgi:hypothetical protein
LSVVALDWSPRKEVGVRVSLDETSTLATLDPEHSGPEVKALSVVGLNHERESRGSLKEEMER